MQPINRRDFLKLASLAGVAVVAAACAPVEPAATSAPGSTEAPQATEVPQASWQGEIEFTAQDMTPTKYTENPDPNAPQRSAFDDVANAWMDLHPGVKLTFLNPPADYGNWLNTSLIGGVGPDVFWNYLGECHAMVDRGVGLSLNDYLELPNKYSSDDNSWKYSFIDPFLTTPSPKSNYGGVPINLVATGVYTNVDAMKAIGVDLATAIDPQTGSPKDWATMIEWCKALKEAGYIPMSPGEGGKDTQGPWTMRMFSVMFLWSWLETFDILNYHTNMPLEYQEGVVVHEEIHAQHWCNDWYPSKDPAYMEMFRVMKEWSQYWQQGFTQEDNGNPYELFATGQLAMFWGGSWRVGDILKDDRRSFEVSNFWIPPITKATSDLAKDPPVMPEGVGGFGTAYGINPKCAKKGNIDECVDWLMYITEPKNNEVLVNEIPSYVPAVAGAKALPEISNMFVGMKYLRPGAKRSIAMTEWTFGERWYDDTQRLIQLFLLDEMDLLQLGTELDKSVDENGPDALRESAIQYSEEGSWDLTKWPCTPAV